MTLDPGPRPPVPGRIALMAILAVLAGVGPAAAQEEPKATNRLRPQFVEGTRSRYEIWSLQRRTYSSEIAGKSRSASTVMQFDSQVSWEVDRVEDDGSATCTMTIDWLVLTMTDPQGNVLTGDSRQEQGEEPMIYQFAQAMSDKPITVEVAANGSITSVVGVEAVQQQWPDADPPKAIDFVEIASDLATLPYAPEMGQVGDDWEAQFNWAHEEGWMKFDTNYTLKEIQDIAGIPVAIVHSSSELELEPDEQKTRPPAGPPIDIQLLAGSTDSQIMFDLQRREVVGRNSNVRSTIQKQANANGITIRQTVEVNIQDQVLRIAEE